MPSVVNSTKMNGNLLTMSFETHMTFLAKWNTWSKILKSFQIRLKSTINQS